MDQNELLWANYSNSQHENIHSLKEIQEIRLILSQAVDEKIIPGAVFALAWHGKIICKESIGNRQVIPSVEPMTSDTIFDLASLTKIVATWPAILILLQNRLIDLIAPLGKYLQLPKNSSLNKTTILDLLTHTSGLPERTYLRQYGRSKQDIIQGICETGLESQKGDHVLYCNRGFILLGFIIEEISHQSLDTFIAENVWDPLQMKETFFNPHSSFISRIAPTEYRVEIGSCQRVTVHDENADWLGGIAGHAGVFSNIEDLTRYCAAILAGGRNNNTQILDNQWISKSFLNYTSGKGESRGLAWEMLKDDNCPAPFWGHTGFTGTSIWINPVLDSFAILLTNRVHPFRENNTGIRQLRNTIRQKCWSLIQDHMM